VSVANRFEVEELKQIAESFIIDRLDMTNAVDLAIFAESHSCTRLLGAAVHCIAQNARALKLFQTEDWDRLAESKLVYDQVLNLLLDISDDRQPIAGDVTRILKVKHAGNPSVNGIYHLDGYHNELPRYVCDGLWDRERVQFVIMLCTLRSRRRRWFITVVPKGGEAGRDSDIDFYEASPCPEHPRKPPMNGWKPAENGQNPPPILLLPEEDESNEEIG